MSDTTTTAMRAFIIRRTFRAPRHAVFRAWTEPALLEWFFNPEQPRPDEPIEVDLRVGGAWRQRMVIDADTSYVTGGVYREIVPDTRLVFAWGAVGGWPELDEHGRGDVPIATVEFADAAAAAADGADGGDGGTLMTCTLALPEHFSDAEARRWLELGIERGWSQTIDRFEPAA